MLNVAFNYWIKRCRSFINFPFLGTKNSDCIWNLQFPENLSHKILLNTHCDWSITELPETSFTRSISNPESVMRRRRQQKLEQKLQQFRSKDGGPDTGGTLKIYGESLCRDVPYKTLLLSVRDNATQVVKEMLAKYGLTREDAHQYCLVQVKQNVKYNEWSRIHKMQQRSFPTLSAWDSRRFTALRWKNEDFIKTPQSPKNNI